jgi:TonB family protein
MRITLAALALAHLLGCKDSPERSPSVAAGSSATTVANTPSAVDAAVMSLDAAAVSIDAGVAAAEAPVDAGAAARDDFAPPSENVMIMGSLGKLESGGDQVEGGLSADKINAVIKEAKHQVRNCYSRALKSNPGLTGKVIIRFEIAKNGNVTAAESARGSTLTDAKVVACVTSVIKTLKFPPPEGGIARVTYPFLFAAQQ